MVVLKYGKGKLLTGAAVTFLAIPLYIGLLLDPPTSHYGTIAALAHHPRLAPMIIGALLVFIWRGVTLATGDAAALEATPTDLVLTNFWGTRHLPWRTMTQVAGKTVRTRYGRYDYLVVRSVDGETKLSLGSTDSARRPRCARRHRRRPALRRAQGNGRPDRGKGGAAGRRSRNLRRGGGHGALPCRQGTRARGRVGRPLPRPGRARCAGSVRDSAPRGVRPQGPLTQRSLIA